MNDDTNFFINIMHLFLSNNHEYVSTGTDYDSEKRIVCHYKILFFIYYQINQIFLNGRFICYFLFSTTINYHHTWIR